MADAGALALAGASGYEGGIGHDGEPQTLAAVAGYCARLRRAPRCRFRPGPADPGVIPVIDDDYHVIDDVRTFF